ncbi:hypothetical protein [Terasakiella pusilla]|uniref:hypothetical protein n=1 Tax=Terasakiella pusilla TaxID=64973 RepID=UPI003AA8AE30
MMQFGPQQPYIDLGETLALRILRSCPKALKGSGLDDIHIAKLMRLKKMLSHCARKAVALHSLNYPTMTQDERCLLNMLAAAQLGQYQLMTQFLQWLMPAWAAKMLQEDVIEIANILMLSDITLYVSYAKPPIRREQAGLYAVIGSEKQMLSAG